MRLPLAQMRVYRNTYATDQVRMLLRLWVEAHSTITNPHGGALIYRSSYDFAAHKCVHSMLPATPHAAPRHTSTPHTRGCLTRVLVWCVRRDILFEPPGISYSFRPPAISMVTLTPPRTRRRPVSRTHGLP